MGRADTESLHVRYILDFYIKCACLNIYWVLIESTLAKILGLCSSLPLLVTRNTVSESVTKTIWIVDWQIALYLHHFGCFYSCVPPAFCVGFSIPLPLFFFVCVNVSSLCMQLSKRVCVCVCEGVCKRVCLSLHALMCVCVSACVCVCVCACVRQCMCFPLVF